jgi:hypothetical protein
VEQPHVSVPHAAGRGLQLYVVYEVDPQQEPDGGLPLGHKPASSGAKQAPPEACTTTQMSPCGHDVVPQGMFTLQAHPRPLFVQVCDAPLHVQT